MRRALLTLWPAFSRVYGFHPWDTERLTLDELCAYFDDYQGLLEAARHPPGEVT